MAITRTGGSWINEYVANEDDHIDTTYLVSVNPELKIPNGSYCYELGSGRKLYYDSENDRWIPSTKAMEG